MNTKIPLVAVSSFFFINTNALPKIEYIPPKPEIREEIASYSPGRAISMSIDPQVVMPPQRGLAQFGGMSINLNSKGSLPWCGPSPKTNTINCFDMSHSGAYMESFPIPGKLSSTPVFYENSWLIGTTKGFLMRVEANSKNRNLPKLGNENINFWGANSRQAMADLKPKPIYTEDSSQNTTTPNDANQPKIPDGVKWVFPASSSFLGTPVIQNGFVYIYAASQYFQAFNWETGKLVWAVRLAPSTNLRLNSDALLVTKSEIYVGSSLGTLLSLNPSNGSILWSWQVPGADETQRVQTSLPAGPDKFYGIVASPTLISANDNPEASGEKFLLVSNAESMTQAISINTHNLLWSYPAGSVAQAKMYKNHILLGTSNGKVVSLNPQNGTPNWSTNATDSSPIMSLFLTKNNVLLAATRSGQIYMLNPETGKILGQNFKIGNVNGEFFPGFDKAEACLSFAFNGFRCFRAKL